ncbi:MAG: hypothetical protein GY863_10180 [bacterium]|nr:hypothetical protein [bacterium]
MEYGPGLAESHTSLGYVYYWDSKFEKGREEFETAIDLNPDYATAHHWYGEMLSEAEGSFEEGIVEIKKALVLDPFSQIMNLDIAKVLLFNGENEKAFDHMNKAYELDPASAIINCMWGYFYWIVNENEKAIEPFKRSIQIDPDYVQGYLDCGLNYLSMDRYLDAIEMFHKIPPDLTWNDPKLLIALTYRHMDQFQESVDILMQIFNTAGITSVDEIYAQIFTSREFNKDTYREFINNCLTKLRELDHQILRDTATMPYLYFYAEEYDSFFAELEKPFTAYRINQLMLPFFDPVRDDPRFIKLMDDSGLSKYYKR